jgi:hypothetical protein
MKKLKEIQYENILKHAENLIAFFSLSGYNTDDEKIKLWKNVGILENKAHKVALNYCNGDFNTDQTEILEIEILNKLNEILNFREKKIIVFFNMDARGYALKISLSPEQRKENNIHTDFGGYGIIAPEF